MLRNDQAKFDAMVEKLHAGIGNYKTKDFDKNIETPTQSQMRVVALLSNNKVDFEHIKIIQTKYKHEHNDKELDLLGAVKKLITKEKDPANKAELTQLSKSLKALYKDCEKPSTDARKTYAEFLATKLENKTDLVNGETIKLEKLLGKKGVTLYKTAVKEERNSIEFRNAVFLNSAKQYPGETWKKRMIAWNGGPSAAGKSYGAAAAINAVSAKMEKSGRNDGNTVVSVDGGIEREVSQMRQLTLQLAQKKGSIGISDLHNNTELKIKGYIRKAALLGPHLSLVIPDTFTNPLKRWFSKMSEYQQLADTVQVYAEVVSAAGEQARFKDTIYQLGNMRAWATKDDLKELEGSLDELNIDYRSKSESKNYNPNHREAGINASLITRNNYFDIAGADALFVPITNDMLFCKKTENGFERRVMGSEDPGVLISQRDFDNWISDKSNANKTLDDLSQWLTQGIKNNTLGQPLIKVMDKVAIDNYKAGHESLMPAAAPQGAPEYKQEPSNESSKKVVGPERENTFKIIIDPHKVQVRKDRLLLLASKVSAHSHPIALNAPLRNNFTLESKLESQIQHRLGNEEQKTSIRLKG